MSNTQKRKQNDSRDAIGATQKLMSNQKIEGTLGKQVRFAEETDDSPERSISPRLYCQSDRLSSVFEEEEEDQQQQDSEGSGDEPLLCCKSSPNPTANVIQRELRRGSLHKKLHPPSRSNSLPTKLRPGVHQLLLKHARRSPSANVIQKEYRYASLRKVDKEARRRSHVPLISTKDLLLDPDLYKSLLNHSRRSPSANVIKKEFRYASLRIVDDEACRRRSEPLISTKDLLLDPDVYELLLAHSKRSPSANVIKKEYRYVCLRKAHHRQDDDMDAASLSSIYFHNALYFSKFRKRRQS